MADGPGRVFVSYAGPDRPWAEWVAWHLREAGYTTELDVWDWRTGDDFVVRMSEAMDKADLVVALFSDDYFAQERWTGEEWTATLARRERLVPVVVRPLEAARVPPILSPRLRAVLHGLDRAAAVDALLRAVNGPVPPATEPAFPGAPAVTPAAGAAEGAPRLPDSVGTPEVWNVGRRNPDFSGREGPLAALRDGLISPRRRVPHVLHGVGGVGKTQIALEYAHRFASQYDLVWWIDAEAAGQIPVHLTDLAGRLGIVDADAGAEANARAALEQLGTQKRWLLILDNAGDPAEVEPWLPPGDGHVLITARDPDWSGIALGLDVDVFTRSESLAFLRERVPGFADDQVARLAEDLGDLPLALDQAAGVLTTTAMSVDAYRRMLADATDRIMRRGGRRSYPNSLAASVVIAAERLRAAHPEAEPLLRLAAFLGPDPIPTEWFDRGRAELATLAVGTADDPMWPWDCLPHLAHYGLARLGDASVQMHRLTQAVLRDNTDEAGVVSATADVASLLTANDPGDPRSPTTWPQWALITSHVLGSQVMAHSAVAMRHVLCRATLYLLSSGRPRDAHDLVAPLLDACTEALGEQDPDTLTCTQYLGHATWDLGDHPAARTLIEDTLERRRQVLGEDHPDTLQSANDFAVTLDGAEDHEKARGLHEDTLERRRRVLGEDHPDTLQSANALATTLYTLDRYPEAFALGEDTLERRRRVLKEDHPDTLESAHGLAVALHALYRYAEALVLREDTLERCRRVLGEDHPDTLRSAHGLASTLHALRRHPEDLALGEDTLERRRRVLKEDHPDTLQSAHNLAVTLHALRRYPEDLALGEDTLERFREALGEDHPGTLQSAHNLAVTLHALRRYPEDLALGEDTLERCRRVLGEDHPDTLRSAHNLAVTLHALRRYPEALALGEDTLERRRRVLGEDHPDTLQSANDFAATLHTLHRYPEAESVLEQIVNRFPNLQGDEDPALKDVLLRVVGLLVVVLQARGKRHQAQTLEKRKARWIPRPRKKSGR